jgi:hypothetical protein
MTPEQRQALLALARQSWIEAEATVYAYDREYHKVEARSKLLKAITVILAVVTAITAVRPDYHWLTFAAAIITAAVAAFEQQYTPAATAQKFWECRTALEAIKRDIVNYSLVLAEATSFQGGAQPLTQASARIGEAMKVPVRLVDEDKARASSAFAGSMIAVLLARADEAITGTVVLASAGVPSDVPDMIPAIRGGAA